VQQPEADSPCGHGGVGPADAAECDNPHAHGVYEGVAVEA
jgi:hypothetical protein